MSGSVALVGFMGAGKSTVGGLVADGLGLPCVDTDALITARHGEIAAIFARDGEAAFRSHERDVACEALAAALVAPAVVCLGGGAVTIDDVREALARLAHVVWIDAPLGVLYARAAGGTRPLARDRDAFERLYREREPLYATVATVTLRTTAAESAADVAARLLRAVA